MGHSKSSSKKEIHNIAGLSQNKGQILILTLYLTLYLRELEKEQLTKPKMSRRKEKLKIRAEINEIES